MHSIAEFEDRCSGIPFVCSTEVMLVAILKMRRVKLDIPWVVEAVVA